jgi:uncharacterized membrane protein YebE (DUF533 family)
MRLIAAAIDDGNVDEDEQREIEQAELQVKHGSQRGDVLYSFLSQKNRNSTTNFLPLTFAHAFTACQNTRREVYA